MTPQEQQMIDGLISRVRSTPIQNKDQEAEQHIQQGFAGSPDALYSLVQTVLVQQYGLQQAQSQINELKQQVQTLQSQTQESAPKSSGGSFLSHIFGSGSTQQQAPQGQQQPPYQPVNNPGYGSQGYPGGSYPAAPPPPAYPAQSYPSSGGGMFGGGGGGMFGGGGGGFMQGALQTAAGVAAGEMMFQGMEDLFHGFGGHERGFGGGGGGETIVNNYYDDDRGGDRNFSGQDSGNNRDFYNPSDDASRSDASETSNFDGGGNDFLGGGSSDANFDDTSSDSGGFDLGGDDVSGDNS